MSTGNGSQQQQGYTCSMCGQWYMPGIYPHVCTSAWPGNQLPATAEHHIARITLALERIAAALEKP